MMLQHMAAIEVTEENTISYQREFWSGVLASEVAHAARTGDWSELGKSWGDPESERAVDSNGCELGDYAAVLARVRSLIKTESVILEIGSYGGKWTQHLHIPYCCGWTHCADLSPEAGDALAQRFNIQGWLGRSFHTISGAGTLPEVLHRGHRQPPDIYVDLIFSMDSLVRAPLDAIGSYLSEFYRVLHVGGHVLVHLPWDDSPGSRERNFTRLSRPWLLAHISQFSRADLDETTLKHGLLLHLVK